MEYYFAVCVTFLTKFSESLTSDEKRDPKTIESKFRDACSEAKGESCKKKKKYGFLHIIHL